MLNTEKIILLGKCISIPKKISIKTLNIWIYNKTKKFTKFYKLIIILNNLKGTKTKNEKTWTKQQMRLKIKKNYHRLKIRYF